MKILILGGGLSGISTAYFLQKNIHNSEITILEKESTLGGLCRSIEKDGYTYDIGPHILFSKDKEMLNLMISVLDQKNDLKRSNQIIYKGRWVQYPFENDLSKLPEDDLKYCITAFNNNPYEQYNANNMIQFFLRTFGEGITNCYLRPYNEKIWKYDPAFMDTSMVDRIPKPTKEEIQRSASGETVDGYLHQLYFSYPTTGGIESVVKGLSRELGNDCKIITNKEVCEIKKIKKEYTVKTTDESRYNADLVISTIPIQELSNSYIGIPSEIASRINKLRYNSIIIAFVRTKKDLCGDNFAFMIPDKDIIFHRISKMDFLGSEYSHGGASYMIEVTYRENDVIDTMDSNLFKEQIKDGICKIGFAENPEEIEIINITRHKYAYVIYDLDHRENMSMIRDYFSKEGIILNGRFGNFEYWNMDRVLRESYNRVNEIIETVKHFD